MSFSDGGGNREEPTSTPTVSRFNLGQLLVIDYQQLLAVSSLREDRLHCLGFVLLATDSILRAGAGISRSPNLGRLAPQSEERPDSGLRLLPPQPQRDYVAQPDLLPPIRPVSRVTSPSTSTRRHDHAPRRAQVRRGPPGARPPAVISLRPAAGHSRVRLHAPP